MTRQGRFTLMVCVTIGALAFTGAVSGKSEGLLRKEAGSAAAQSRGNSSQPNMKLKAADPWVSIPALVLGTHGDTTRNSQGLSMPPGFQNGATGQIAVPSDWDGVSDFTVSLYFTPDTDDAGTLSFFICPTGMQVGQFLADPGAVVAPGVDVPAGSVQRLFVQNFTVSGRVAATDDIFHFSAIERQGPGDTFPGSVTLLLVKISYN